MKKNILLLLFLLSVSYLATAQKPTTLTYFKNDTLTLDLELFMPKKTVKNNLPLVIFVHGGGFSGGDRSAGHKFCSYLAENGFAAATISYTLYMKDKNFSCGGILSEKVKAMQYGANDLWLATNFFLKNKEKYNIDTTRIFIAGSSAGAETGLHAAFWDRKTMSMYNTLLPENFKYAGLISGAGAIMDINLINPNNLIPVMLFHGNGDALVPYATAAHHYCKTNAPGWMMLFGSFSIYNRILEMQGTSHLFTFCGGGHEYSGELFYKNPESSLKFLNEVMNGKKFQDHTIIATGKKNERSAAYKFCD